MLTGEVGQGDHGGADEAGGEQAGGGGAAASAEGKQIFTQSCGTCHTLSDAGTQGNVGPNLDESKPDYELAVDRVTNGKGGMPAFKDSLSEAQIKNVSAYVAESAGDG